VENARYRDLNSDIPVCLSTDTLQRSCVFIDGPVTGLTGQIEELVAYKASRADIASASSARD
jgi:hypothetical protein